MIRRTVANLSIKNHLLSCNQLSIENIKYLFKRSEYFENIEKNPSFTSPGYDRPSIAKDAILMNAFFEPSTRTMLSFESAMYKLGGKVINFNKDFSSKKKGESDNDTVKSLQNYADIMVIRHPKKGFVENASQYTNIPIINGGDGNGEHPTQALLDLYTIYKNFKDFFDKDGARLNILIVGDIKHSRTVHSLVDILKHYPRIKINLLPYQDREPDLNFMYNIALQHNQVVEDILVSNANCEFDKFDVIYMTRMQEEREKYKNDFENLILNNEVMKKCKENAIVMHPLPRNHEINTEIDEDERCIYFEQMKNGVYVRMAILDLYMQFIKYKDLKETFFI